jgi:MFS family permease
MLPQQNEGERVFDSTAPPRAERWSVKATIVAASSLSVLAGTAMTAALPLMEAYFNADPDAGVLVRMVLTISSLTIAICTPFAGAIVDRMGRRGPLALGLLLFGVAGTSGTFLDSLHALLASRVVLGIGVSFIMTATTALIADYYQGDARARFIGLQAALMGFGGVVFLAGGGALAEFGWRPPFLIHALALLVIPTIFWVLWQSPRTSEPGIDDDAGMPWGIVSFLFAAVFIGMGSFYVMLVQTPFQLQRLGVSPGVGGAVMGISVLVGAVVSIYYARLKSRLRFGALLTITFTTIGVGLALIGLAESLVAVVVGQCVLGIGLGILMPNCNLWLTVRVPAPLRGRAVGLYGTGIFLGQFIGPLAAEPLVVHFGLGLTMATLGAALFILSLPLVLMPDHPTLHVR